VRKLFIISVLALGLPACKNQESSSPPRYEETPADEGTPVKEVVKDPQYGERITVEGKVDQVFGPQTFTMKAPLFREDLLVVAPKDLVIEALAAPDEVEVTGMVRKMTVSEVEREYAIDFDNAVEVKWEARPYIAAESLRRKTDGDDGGDGAPTP
jgi:hypothetical protein